MIEIYFKMTWLTWIFLLYDDSMDLFLCFFKFNNSFQESTVVITTSHHQMSITRCSALFILLSNLFLGSLYTEYFIFFSPPMIPFCFLNSLFVRTVFSHSNITFWLAKSWMFNSRLVVRTYIQQKTTCFYVSIIIIKKNCFCLNHLPLWCNGHHSAYIRKFPGSNLSREIAYSDWAFVIFLLLAVSEEYTTVSRFFSNHHS